MGPQRDKILPGVEWGKGIPGRGKLQNKQQGSLATRGVLGWEGGLEWEAASLWPCSQHVGVPSSGAEALGKEWRAPSPSPPPSKGPQGEAALPARSSQTSVSSVSEEEELREPASLLSSSPQTAREWRIPLRWSSSRRRCCGLFGLWC